MRRTEALALDTEFVSHMRYAGTLADRDEIDQEIAEDAAIARAERQAWSNVYESDPESLDQMTREDMMGYT